VKYEGLIQMMLRKKLFNRVESDAGFVIKIRAFQGFVEYREGRRIATVPVQPVFGRGLVSVYMDTPVKWNPPDTADVILEKKRTEILKNIVDAMQFRKYKVEVVEKTKGSGRAE
jgi:hypothetical protein